MRQVERGIKSLKLGDTWTTRLLALLYSLKETQEAKALKPITFEPTDVKISFITSDPFAKPKNANSHEKPQVTVGCLKDGRFFWSDKLSDVNSGFEIDEDEVGYRFNPGRKFFEEARR